MSIPASIIGTSYTANEISLGSIAGSIDFTESKLLSDQKVFGSPIGPNAVATVTATGIDPMSSNPTITFLISKSGTVADGQTISGTVIGNDPTDLLVQGTFLGQPGILFVTNTPAQQPGVNGTAHVTPESASPAYTPACYCPGTLILTPSGERPVEGLAIGDTVLTAAGDARPVRWIGRRAYAARFVAANPALRPVRIRAGALGEGLPRRDLLVSGEHGMAIDGVLVPARLLVDGHTIVRDHAPGEVTYLHVELDSHDLLVAEGVAAESFLDDGSRGVFHNAAEFHARNPGATAPEVRFCAPRVEHGPALDAILARRRAARQAA